MRKYSLNSNAWGNWLLICKQQRTIHDLHFMKPISYHTTDVPILCAYAAGKRQVDRLGVQEMDERWLMSFEEGKINKTKKEKLWVIKRRPKILMFDYACKSFQSISPLCRFDRICGSWDKEPYLLIAVLRFNLAKTRSMNEKRIVLRAKSYFYTKNIKSLTTL